MKNDKTLKIFKIINQEINFCLKEKEDELRIKYPTLSFGSLGFKMSYKIQDKIKKEVMK